MTGGVIISAAGGLFFVLSVALISPPSANRALLPRIYITVLWLLSGLVTLGWAWHEKEPGIIFVWTVIMTVLLVASLVVTVSNSDHLSIRVRRKIPASSLPKTVAFFFYNGAAGGLLWVGSLLALTFIATEEFFTAVPSVSGDSSLSEFEQIYPPMMIYVFAYALTGLFIHRKFLSRRSPKFAGILAVFVAGLAAIGPNLVLFFLNRLSWSSVEKVQLGSAANVMISRDAGERMSHLIFASAWLLLMVFLNAKWFIAQAKNFRRPPAIVPPTLP
jgi:hypothetical protein